MATEVGMVVGVVLAGVMSGMASALLSVAAGHPIETTLIVYMVAGMLGAVGFVATATRHQVEVLR